MTEEERARRRDDFLATLYAASETPELIPTLADEYITEHGYPMVVGETIRVQKPCSLVHCDDTSARDAKKSRCFWYNFLFTWPVSVIFLGAAALSDHAGWAHQDQALSWGWLGMMLMATMVGCILWSKFAAMWKYAT